MYENYVPQFYPLAECSQFINKIILFYICAAPACIKKQISIRYKLSYILLNRMSMINTDLSIDENDKRNKYMHGETYLIQIHLYIHYINFHFQFIHIIVTYIHKT